MAESRGRCSSVVTMFDQQVEEVRSQSRPVCTLNGGLGFAQRWCPVSRAGSGKHPVSIGAQTTEQTGLWHVDQGGGGGAWVPGCLVGDCKIPARAQG